jgi:hypothetical protein
MCVDPPDSTVTWCSCMQILQSVEGYEQFEKRRRAKFSKALEGGVMLGRKGMDEGIDVPLKD